MNADGTDERIALRRLLPGDRIQVLPGETFPVDGVVVQGETMVDEALLTGESRPVARGVGATVIAGSHNLSSVVQVRVDKIGNQTRFAQIVSLMESASTTKPSLARIADRIAKPFLIAVLLAAGLACAYWWGRDPGHALMIAVAVLVVTCPCALSLATPTAMLAAAGWLARRGVLVRRLEAFEAVAGIDTLLFDKTGTLTRDAMVLQSTRARDGFDCVQTLAMAATLAQYSLHPVSRALVTAAAQQGSLESWRTESVREITGQGLSARVIGPGGACDLRLGSAAFCGIVELSNDSSRTYMSDTQGWLATFEFQEELRLDAASTVAALERQGIAVHLLSGDSAHTVAAVAGCVGINKFQGDCTPQDKLDFLRSCQRTGMKVAVVGDGLNDGPVLAGAHVSFAFGQSAPLTQAQADFVVLGDQLNAVVETLQLGRRTLRVVRQNLWWAALYNAVCVPLAVIGLLPAWLAGLGMASSSLLVILNSVRLSISSKKLVET
jgi:Cu2+-exporting ATPase